MYAIIPNNPNINVLAAFPILPPIPKLLTNKRMDTASKIQSTISLSNSSPLGFLRLFFLPVDFLAEVFPVLLRLREFFRFAAIISSVAYAI